MTLAEIIYERIPPATLERVVYDQGVINQTRFAALFKASGLSAEEIAKRVVVEYGYNTAKLASGLYHQISQTDWDTSKNLYEHFNKSAELQYDNHQSSLVGRYPTLSIDQLSEFLNSVKRQVCLIVCRKGPKAARRGTGFLVAPDLILTSRHVLADFALNDNIEADGNRVEIIFDFFQGDPVDSIPSNLHDVRKLGLSQPWHVASCDGVYSEGKVVELSEEQMARLSEALDFILLRLEDPVGLQSLAKGGGRRRGWIQLPPAAVSALPTDEWIIIPQHPNGVAQRIDLGRFLEMDDTRTRLRYNTNTAKGTSGAPCFDHKFNLVGIHNAQVGPGEKAWANEAISFDKIASLVRQHVQNATRNLPNALRWSIARDDEQPQVVLGREKILLWLIGSATSNPGTLADRVYAAIANQPSAGCSFSVDLLHAEIRNSRTPRAIFGARGQQLSATAEDFLLALLRELGISLDKDEVIPARPTSNSEAVTGEIDKLERWLSDEIPNWLGGIIIRHVQKEIDGRIAARQALNYYRENNQSPPDEIVKNADAVEPFFVRPNSWDFAYIVIDDLRGGSYQGSGSRSELKGEVRSLIAALVKGKAENSMHPGLRRLRWMFLGFLPDFMSPNANEINGATIEVLDPETVGKAEVSSVVDRMWQALVPKQDISQIMVDVAGSYIVQTAERVAGLQPRLARLQREVNNFALNVLQTIGS